MPKQKDTKKKKKVVKKEEETKSEKEIEMPFEIAHKSEGHSEVPKHEMEAREPVP